MKLKWLNNLQNIIDENKPGTCPFCDSDNTDYSVKVVDEKTMMGYGSIWCNDCKNAFHISRMKILDGMKKQPIPNDLSY